MIVDMSTTRMNSWDTFSFFETLINGFGVALQAAGGNALRLAVEGFQLSLPASAWTGEHAAFIQQRIQTELSEEALAWYEECAPAVAAFSCFALGALLGKFAQGEIDDSNFRLGEAHLPGFVSLNDARICAAYQSERR